MVNVVPVEAIIERANQYKIKGDRTPESTIIEWIWQALSELGGNRSYEFKESDYQVIGGKIQMPSDVDRIETLRNKDLDVPMDNIGLANKFIPNSYRVQNGWIWTSFDSGEVTLKYRTLLADERGWPLVVDNEAVKKMVVDYIIKEKVKIASLIGELPYQQFQLLDREFAYSKNAAREAMTNLTPDEWSRVEKAANRPYIDIRR